MHSFSVIDYIFPSSFFPAFYGVDLDVWLNLWPLYLFSLSLIPIKEMTTCFVFSLKSLQQVYLEMVSKLAGIFNQSNIITSLILHFFFFFFTVLSAGLPPIIIKDLRFPHHLLERFIYRGTQTHFKALVMRDGVLIWKLRLILGKNDFHSLFDWEF